ncbi:MAG TPA: hypothetical protein PKC49_04115 [Phycisphaerae bacterium]|nr:hypothetical protein [Phycisphaerae bacterium]
MRQAAQSDADALRELQRIRRNIEAAPDDKGRLARQLTLAWAAAPAWIGLSRVEASHEAEQPPLKPGVFDRAAIWELAEDKLDGDIARHAPAIVIEWPDHRDYPDNYDRFGEVYLMGSPDDVHVGVNPSRPIIYTYRSEAKIRGRRYPQFVYAWWFPERPAMSNNDPAAGHIDGDTLRITLGSDGRPAIFEVTQSCGCGHVVFVADHVEEQARKQFGKPLSGKNLSVERDVAGKRDLIVSGSVPVADESVRPIVYILAGFHGVRDVQCAKPSEPINDVEAVERHAYDLCPYDKLDRLPFGDRYASMFGPDGLVHNAGRAEGFLLAPTGIMSAGQPRKRGTQKIRWDDYSFDDPSLLEKTLRLPDAF